MFDFIASVIYFMSWPLIIVSFFYIHKSSEQISFVVFFPLAFFLTICLDGVFAALYSLLVIPFNILSIASARLIFAGIAFVIRKDRQFSKIVINKVDFLFILAAILLTLICSRAHYGADFTPHYIAPDAAAHLRAIVTMFRNQSVSGMFLAHAFGAEILGAIYPFIDPVQSYIALQISDILLFAFGSSLPYCLLKSIYPKVTAGKQLIFGFVSLLYLVGYPLNNFIYGFYYLGLGVAVSACLATICTIYWTDSTPAPLLFIFLLLFGVITSYALFAPIVFLITLILFFVKLKQKSHRFILNYIRRLLPVFLIPGIAGIFFTYFGTFRNGDEAKSVVNAISREGGIYRNLYSNQLLFLPFALTGAFYAIKHGDNKMLPSALMFLGIMINMFVFFFLMSLGFVSTYYFFKLYYLLSPFIVVIATIGLVETLDNQTNTLCLATCIVIAISAFLSITKLDSRLSEKNAPYGLGVPVESHPCFDIYQYNYSHLKSSPSIPDIDTFKLFERASYYTTQTDDVVPLLANYEYVYWFQATVPQDNYTEQYLPWLSTESVTETLLEKCQYVVVLNREAYPELGSDESIIIEANIADHVTIVFENNCGYIAEINSNVEN